MSESGFLSSFVRVPMGHKLIALLIAGGIAFGGHAWQQRQAALSADAAQLSFNGVDARSIDSGLATAHDSAVVLAQSVLTDSVVEQLSASAPLASTSLPSRLGEFRSHLQLTQVSGSALNVRFTGPDNIPSDSTADTIAQAIAKATFSAYGAPLVSAQTPPQSAPAPVRAAPPKPAKSAAAPKSSANSTALAAPLGDLDALLSSTRRDLDRIAFAGAGGRRPSDPARFRESDQQHLLKARVSAAEQKINQIRSSSAAQDLPRAAAAQLAEIQHAVASIISGGKAGAHGYRSVGVDAAQVRRERAQLDDAIATVHRERLALQQEAGNQADSGGDTASSTPPAATSTADLPAQQDAAPAAQPPATGDLLPNPFTFAENAAPPTPSPWWRIAAIGMICGLLYWTFAALPERETDYGQGDMPEPIYTGSNLITPPSSPAPRREPEAVSPIAPRTAPQAAPQAVPALFSLTREEDDLERHSRRASFRFEPAGPQVRIPEQIVAQKESAVQPAEESAVKPAEELAPAEEPALEDIAASPIIDSSAIHSSPETNTSPQPTAAPFFTASEPVPEMEARSAALADVHILTPAASGQPRRRRTKPPLASGFRSFRRAFAQTGHHEETADAEPFAERDEDSERRPGRSDDLAS
jgi:hypothetical protein